MLEPQVSLNVISFQCRPCGRQYQVGLSLAGKRVKCKACGNTIQVPVPMESAAPRTRSSSASGGGRAPARQGVADRPAKPADPYGLNQDPNAAPKRSRPTPDQPPPLDAYDLSEEPLPPRAARPEEDEPAPSRRAKAPKSRPKQKSFRLSSGGGGEGGGLRRFGVTMLIIGVGSFVLPMVGLQFKLINIFGEYQLIAGGACALGGLVLVVTSPR